MGKVKEVFGKESGIKLSDVQRRIVENELEESATVEYKNPVSATKLDDDLVEAVLVRPVVSFLNALARQGSLLVLGVDAKKGIPEELVPIQPGLLTPEKIRAFLTNRIGSIPQVRNFPDFRIIPIRYGSKGYVFLVELRDWEPAGYFSKTMNLPYIRRGDESHVLQLPEFFSLVKATTSSKSFLNIENARVKTEGTPSKTTYSMQVACRNRGSVPASYVGGFIEIKVPEGANPDVHCGASEVIDVTHLNPGRFKLFSFTMSREFQWPLYPGSSTVIGDLVVVADQPIAFDVRVDTNDADGTTNQMFHVDIGGAVTQIAESNRTWG